MLEHHTSTSFAGFEDLTIPIHNNNNLQYFGEIGLGSGHKPFRVIFDTGSERLWVPHIDCSSAVCKAHHRFDPTQSDTFVPQVGNPKNLSYGTGHVQVQMHRDSLSFPSAKEKLPSATAAATAFDTQTVEYPVGLATSIAKRPFENLSMIDGIFGMGPKTEFANSNKLFSFYLSNDTAKDGALTLGHPEGDVSWHKMVDPNSWSVDLVGVKVGNQFVPNTCSPESPCKALIDTGSSNITGPPGDVENVLAKLHPVCGNKEGENVTLLIKSSKDGPTVPYVLRPKEYSVDFRDTKECSLGISGLNMGHKKWVLGDTFLRRYVSVFDQANHRVGFVKSHHENEDIGVVTREIHFDNLQWLLLLRRKERASSFLFN